MVLVVGGSFQGKLEYVKKKLTEQGIHLKKSEILDGEEFFDSVFKDVKILNGLHRMVLNCIRDMNPEEDKSFDAEAIAEKCKKYLDGFLQNCPQVIIICDEVGYGVIPLERKERCYREAVGRLLCYLAQRAEQMERIVGGIPMIIKASVGKEKTWNLSGSDME